MLFSSDICHAAWRNGFCLGFSGVWPRSAIPPLWPRHGPVLTPTTWAFRVRHPMPSEPDQFGSYVRRLAELLDVEQAHQEGRAVLALAGVEQLVDEALAPAAAVDQDVLHLDQPVEVELAAGVRLQPVTLARPRRA